MRALFLARTTLVILLVLGACAAWAQSGLPTPQVSINMGAGAPGKDGDVSASLQILAMLTVLSLAPAILILTTAFTRIVIIFGFLRSAIGTPTIPPNQVVIGLSLFLTFFVMAPTYDQVNTQALQPYLAKEIPMNTAIERAQGPVREFMLKNTYEKDLGLFLRLSKQSPKTRNDVSLVSLIPAFVISELKTAFLIGFYLFVPFLIIDLIVASGLMSMGMMMLPPTVVSLPAKVLVFVLADGWSTLVSAILAGYR
ncbi:MAG: flagellar type III secretion system pore protein FliP [Fimbriimonadaceae bacterium]|nr:flagellar type III secretion system pore protein FliP [Fimbriimonadaceae bacterium]